MAGGLGEDGSALVIPDFFINLTILRIQKPCYFQRIGHFFSSFYSLTFLSLLFIKKNRVPNATSIPPRR